MIAQMQEYTTMVELDRRYNGIRRTVKNFNYYDDTEELIRHFLRCSILNDWSFFDFNQAFETVRTPIYNKLAEHALIPFEEFMENEEALIGRREMDELGDRWGIENNYVYLAGSEIFEAIQKVRYDRLRETFLQYDTFTDLMELYDNLQLDSENRTLEENIKLFDSCIHAEHVNGDIFFDEFGIRIDDIKEDTENEIGE